MKKSDKRKVLYVVEDETSAQFRYRVKNVAEALEGSKWEAEWVLRDELDGVDLSKFDLIVILRQTDKDGEIGRFIEKIRGMGKKVLFDLDDLIFDYRDLPVLMQATNSKNVFYWAGYFWGVRRIAKRVDGFLCTNDFLGKKLGRSFKKPYRVISNSLNREQVEVSGKLLSKEKHSNFVVGYFSGSPTHTKDFRLVEPELERLLENHEDVMLRVVGDMEFSREMQGWIEKRRVEVVDKVDYLKLQELMAGVDVNIAPLLVNDFTNCKSELKFFEAAAVETTTVASPTYAFERAITDGKNGYLAQPGEWYDKLEYLCNNPKKNHEVALVAKKYALENYYGEKFLKEVEAAYDGFIK